MADREDPAYIPGATELWEIAEDAFDWLADWWR